MVQIGGQFQHRFEARFTLMFRRLVLGVTAVGCMGLGWTSPATAGSINATITNDGGAAVADAVVFAVPTVPPQGKPAKALMSQENQQFVPFVLPIQVGTTVEFPNRDSFRHHVYSFSQPKPFELKLFGGTETQMVTFDKEGAVALGCNIHDNMLAYIYVVPTPYFAKTDERGKVSLANLPAGAYTVKTWHPNQKTAAADTALTIAADGTADVKSAIAMKRQRKQKKPGAKDETEY
jgi:plastocyanin